MPSPVGHTLGAYAALVALQPDVVKTPKRNALALGTAFVFGSMADADFLVAYMTHTPALHHHYFSHSILFALVMGCFAYVVLKLLRKPKAGWYAALVSVMYGTHLLLDYFAHDGSYPYGIPLLWPFTTRHFVTPIPLFYSIRRGEWHDLFSTHNAVAALIETAITGPLALIAYLRARKIASLEKVR